MGLNQRVIEEFVLANLFCNVSGFFTTGQSLFCKLHNRLQLAPSAPISCIVSPIEPSTISLVSRTGKSCPSSIKGFPCSSKTATIVTSLLSEKHTEHLDAVHDADAFHCFVSLMLIVYSLSRFKVQLPSSVLMYRISCQFNCFSRLPNSCIILLMALVYIAIVKNFEIVLFITNFPA